MTETGSARPRARDLGIPLEGAPGHCNAITDVAGVAVGHLTLIADEPACIRTGITAILPRGRVPDPVFAGTFAWNGNGEMTGSAWIEESGFLEGPVLLTNTHSVGVVRDAAVAWMLRAGLARPLPDGSCWLLPVVAETYDGLLNDINGWHLKPEHAWAALDSAAGGQVAEGNVGGGTGMICHGFKGGIGTASRQLGPEAGGFTLGVLVQANHGTREGLTIAGVPLGRLLPELRPSLRRGPPPPEVGSIIGVLATDAPLLPHQLKRLARRMPLGLGRTGAFGANGSGDLFLAFSTANPGAGARSGRPQVQVLPNDLLDPLFAATVHVVEEAILNSLVAAETLKGIHGNLVHALPHDRLRELLRRLHRT